MTKWFRSGAALLTGLLLAGCASSPHPYDPFEVGPTQVPPPHVYGDTPRGPVPYNQLGPSQSGVVPSNPFPQDNSYGAPSGYGGAPGQAAAPDRSPGGPGVSPMFSASTGKTPVPPRPTPAVSEAYQGTPPNVEPFAQAPAEPTGNNVESAGYLAGAELEAGHVESIELAEQPSGPPATGVPAAATEAGQPEPQQDSADPAVGSSIPYGNAPDHSWLRGQLEYSHVEGAWKIRYAPLDVENDPYGGSVVLGNDRRLSAFQEGDVVHVEGRVVRGGTGIFSAGPRYELRSIQGVQ